MDAITSNSPSPPSHVCVMAEWPIKENPDILSFPPSSFSPPELSPLFFVGEEVSWVTEKKSWVGWFPGGGIFSLQQYQI